jgi:predicted outer membrane repeat protein
MPRPASLLVGVTWICAVLVGCNDDPSRVKPDAPGAGDAARVEAGPPRDGPIGALDGKRDGAPSPGDRGVPGNPNGKCAVPAEAQAESVASPTTVVGNGTQASCTSAAFVAAVAKGGVITFNCGPDPVTITLTETAKIFNDKGPKIVIDGGGKVTLSGGGKVRILYQNTCDQAQKWTTSHCNDQDHPLLTVQNLTFVDGNAKGLDPDGGGAIFARGGRLKVVNCIFRHNVCDDVGPDVGGAAIRAFDQSGDLPLYVVQSTFGGASGLGGVCSNGGGLSSIGVSYTVLNSLFSHNAAIGNGANPAKAGTPGGGSGGAIYNDGDTFTLTLCGVQMNNNTAKEGGGAIFFVSNNGQGELIIKDSTLENNPSGTFETKGFPGIFALAKGGPQVINSTIK